jgi:deoxycytidylate deaminase
VTDRIQRIDFPELFFGFVSPIGADITGTIAAFRRYFRSRDYSVVEIKATDIFLPLSKYVKPDQALVRAPLQERYRSYIAYGNQLRARFDDEIIATAAINRIVQRRLRFNLPEDARYSKTVYLVHQFKREEEIDLLRSVYGRLFFQVSVYSRRGARVDYLSRRFANSRNSAAAQNFRSDAEAIIQKDENEVDAEHGQRVAKIFHNADFIISLDSSFSSVDDQVARFCELIFSSNSISPTKMEYGMFAAKAAALRTLDLSRQVGAAIFTESGEIITLGSNEVPKALGGTYWPFEGPDDREFARGYDSNDERKREILGEIVSLLGVTGDINEIVRRKEINDSQFMDALEYGRIVHAEMSAISDAARLGRPVKDAILYCTTFPCHMCAKHKITVGVKRVVFLEPYPKSLASEFHSDSLEIEGSDRGKYKEYPAVMFEHFFGITPRRYRELFERGKRKDDNGEFLPYVKNQPRPLIDIKAPFYTQLENVVLSDTVELLVQVIREEESQKLVPKDTRVQ